MMKIGKEPTMLDFPKTATEVRTLAENLVCFLKKGIKDKQRQFDWTYQNISLLDRYYRDQGLACFFTGSPDGPEFLWDFVGYVKDQGRQNQAEGEAAEDVLLYFGSGGIVGLLQGENACHIPY
jgi:hypothetical protein